MDLNERKGLIILFQVLYEESKNTSTKAKSNLVVWQTQPFRTCLAIHMVVTGKRFGGIRPPKDKNSVKVRAGLLLNSKQWVSSFSSFSSLSLCPFTVLEAKLTQEPIL